MVRKLRNKFMIVTMSLLIMLFGGFLIINSIFTRHWNGIEIVGMLEWISNSGIFSENTENTTNEELIIDITKDDSPIAGILLDKDGNIIDSQIIGEEIRIEIPRFIIDKMCVYKSSRTKVGRYYYYYSELESGDILLVIMNTSANKNIALKILGIVVLVISGVILLGIITFHLSKYITIPAENAMLKEKRFISDASHELKTPLGAISINAQALEIDNSENIYIKNIISESKRMSRLIERLLILSKFDEMENIVFTNICLSELCEEMALTYESLAYEKGLVFHCEIEPGIKIEGDEDEIRQLLAILIDNAIKNSFDSGKIHIKCYCYKKHKCIEISNTGVGIKEEDIPYIFDRFYTSDLSREKASFGLGLAIAKSIVDRHKGNITAKSTLNESTTLKVVF